MIPVAEACLFLGIASFLVLAGHYHKRLARWKFVVGMFTALSALSLLVLYDRLHPVSSLLLAAGVGAAGGRAAERITHVLRQTVMRAIPLMVGIVLILAAGLNLWLVGVERRAVAALPPIAPAAPNVLLIVLDTVRAADLSLYGYERPTTPNLERFARRGVRFDRAIAPSPWTLPTHATLFTGRWGHEHGADWGVPLDGTFTTLAEFLSAQGYRTGGFVGNHVYASWETGLGRGFSRYEAYEISLEEWLRSSILIEAVRSRSFSRRTVRLPRDYQMAADVSSSFLEWQEKDPRPFFAFLNYYDAHMPYDPPEPFKSRFGAERSERAVQAITRWHAEFEPALSEEEAQAAKAAYDACIAFLDAELGSLFDELERRGILDETLVIVTSDHGEEFGEHGVFEHANSLYLPALHVPLVMVYEGGLSPGRIIEHSVSLRDVPATIVALLGLPDSPFPGQSLMNGHSTSGMDEVGDPILSEVSQVSRAPNWVPTSNGDMRSIVRGSLHIIVNPDGRREIYDIVRDPWEQHDLVKQIAPSGSHR